MKKTFISILAVGCLTACGNAPQPEAQTADSTAVEIEQPADSEVAETTETVEEDDEPTGIDFETGVLKVNGVRYEFAKVEAGTFIMGDDSIDEFTGRKNLAHQVTLTKDYYIGKTEVTCGLWKAVMGSYPDDFKPGVDPDDGLPFLGTTPTPDNLPVIKATFEDCQLFISTLNATFGECANFRLPTEAEWEFAARGGNKSKHYKYSGSNTLGDVAWYEGNCEDGENFVGGVHKVATKKPNELGIYDMCGNAEEWCNDIYAEFDSKPQTDPQGPEDGDEYDRVFRGGCAVWRESYCRVTSRSAASDVQEGNGGHGFRIAFTPWKGH